MNVRIESTKAIKPIYDGISPPSHYIPLSIFDKFTYNFYQSMLFAYRPPSPPNATIEYGLKKALSEYREYAGRFGEDEKGNPVILLNDNGVKLIEASVDSNLEHVMPMVPSPVSHGLYPSLDDADEIVLVQLTRFTCGSLVVCFSAHHLVSDGHSDFNFLVAWGKASRGLDMSPLPLHDRTMFKPRNPPQIEFEHLELDSIRKLVKIYPDMDKTFGDVIVHKVNFTRDFLSKIKAMASPSSRGTNIKKPCTTYEGLTAHLWRAITKARGLSGLETTNVILPVDGRSRMIPRVPNQYFGNMVLWAFPKSRINDILEKPLPYVANLVHDATANVNDSYFKSYIDFASYKAEQDVYPSINYKNMYQVYCPNLKVTSLVQFPFYDIDFGGGSPFLLFPSNLTVEGIVYLLPSSTRDGSIDALVSLFKKDLAAFNEVIYKLDHWRSCL